MILLDSVVRNSAVNTTAYGSTSNMTCAVDTTVVPSLKGLRLGLPSTIGWNTTGLSMEVWPLVLQCL